MSWLRLDDGFADHPKIASLTASEALRWVRVLLYCARYETDGKVSRAVLKRYGLDTKREKLLGLRLLDERVWEEEEHLFVHDYLDYNPSQEDQEKQRERWRDYKAQSRKRTDVRSGIPLDSTRSQATSAQGASPSPSPKSKPSELRDGDIDFGSREGLHPGKELKLARILELVGRAPPEKVDVIRGLGGRASEAVLARLVEELGSGRPNDRLAYAIGTLRREVGA